MRKQQLRAAVSGRSWAMVLVLVASIAAALQRSPATSTVLAQAEAERPAIADDAYSVVISVQHSEDEARASFAGLQERYPSLLGKRVPIVRKVQVVGSVMYRVSVGPFDHDAATQFCDRLKKAGGACFIPRR